MRWRAILLVTAAALLALGTVLVFLTFDSSSHSVSDTLRPFLITMLPVWVVFGFAAQQLRRPRSVD